MKMDFEEELRLLEEWIEKPKGEEDHIKIVVLALCNAIVSLHTYKCTEIINTRGFETQGSSRVCPTKTPKHRHIDPWPRPRKVSPEM
jgi:hypothetical protein